MKKVHYLFNFIIFFYITLVPHNASIQKLGNPSSALIITQIKNNQPEIHFDFTPVHTPLTTDVVYPSLEIVNFKENIGMVDITQLYYAVADVTLRVSNKGKKKTDPVEVSISDQNTLMRQNSPNIIIQSISPNASPKTVEFHLVARMSEEEQYGKWHKKYIDNCGVDLRAFISYAGSKSLKNRSKSIFLPKEGWSDYTNSGYSTLICDSSICVSSCDMSKSIHEQLDGNVAGYSFIIGQYPRFEAYGQARDLDGIPIPFTSITKVPVASVSKLVTAIAAVRILDKKNISLDAAIGPYFPSDWIVSSYVENLTFAQLLSQTSGIKDYGNGVGSNTYDALKSFFSQSVSQNTTTTCQGPAFTTELGVGINPNDLSPCYSNLNFSIFRVLLPKIAGIGEDMNPITRPQTLANQYVELVQQNVFDLVGQVNVECKPQFLNSAFSYEFPSFMKFDWGDQTLEAGGAGWYLSVEDMAKVLMSINEGDGKILKVNSTENLGDTLRIRRLGLDNNTDSFMEKNGGFDWNGTIISTSAAIFGPVTGPQFIGILFINSNIAGGPSANQGARNVLIKAYEDALLEGND